MNCESGSPLQITKSPSLPGSSEPTRSSIAIARADPMVTVDSACSGVSPVRNSLPASQFIRLAIWLLSECSEVTTPASIRIRALYAVASYASSLKAPQSLQTTAATPEAASSGAIL